MESIEFALDTGNLKNIPLHKYATDFTFLIDGKKYKTNRFVADLLSPIIRKYHFIDETINEFSFDSIINDKNDEDYFQDFLILANFTTNNIDLDRRKYYSKYFLILGNIEEYFRISPEYSEGITLENAVELLIPISAKEIYEGNTQLQSKISNNIKQLVSFISQNFELIDKEQIKKLDIDIIEEIISNESLQLQEEDSLLNFLIDLYEKDCRYSPLFEYVIFSNVKNDTFESFMSRLSLHDINNSIWKSICKRFDFSERKSQNKKLRYNCQEQIQNFECQKGKEFDGIMKYLTNTTDGSIDITSNSILDDRKYHPKNLVDYDKNNGYASKDDGNAFVSFDFKDKSIQLTNYSIQSANAESNYHHLKNWVLEVSNDANDWFEIDCQENCSKLNGKSLTASFEVHKKDDYFRFVRIRQTGNSWAFWGNRNSLFIHSIEFFGKIKFVKIRKKYVDEGKNCRSKLCK